MNVAVIGSGFSGLSAACHLAKQGFNVTILEKNSTPGGRARMFKEEGFTFDMGPSWYWMPDVFEHFFQQFGKSASDYYQLKRLDPSYKIVYSHGDELNVPAGVEALTAMFEKLEPGSGKKLAAFLEEGKYKYAIGINELVYKPGLSLSELIDIRLIAGVFKLHVFQSLSSYVRKFFKSNRLVQLLEFPVLFLGATPQKIPALYSLMNYADMALGTWYPMGGMIKVIEGMVSVALEQGVKIEYNSAVDKIETSNGKVSCLHVNGLKRTFDFVVSSADYHHTEQHLLAETDRHYTEEYWDKRVLAPSSLIFYVGLNRKVPGLLHHTLFFDQDFGLHAREIYESPRWPTAPQFYVSCPSQTDPSVAPDGCENLFFLIPVAPGLTDSEETREKYFSIILDRFEKLTGENIRENICYKRSFAHRDFIKEYNAYKGNAYGLANTLLQTANLKPSIENKKVTNLLYTGQLTVPGPGVPPCIISGEVVAREIGKRAGLNR